MSLFFGKERTFGSTLQRAHQLAPILLAGIAALTFARSVQGTFIWDDRDLIENNPFVKDWRYLGRNLVRPFWDVPAMSEKERADRANIYYRPLVTLSFMLDHRLHDGEPRGFHLTNVLLHVLVVLLAYLLASRLLQGGRGPPLVAALVFAVHPSRAEAVSWICGRSEVLMGLFSLSALLLFWRALAAPDRRRRTLALAGAWAAYTLALLSKETAVALAVVVPALDWLLLCRGDRRLFLRRAAWCHLPLVLATALLLVGRLILQLRVLGPRDGLGLLARLDLLLETLGHYGLLVLRPYQPSVMVGAFHNPAHPEWALLAGGALVLLAGVGGLALAWRRSRTAALALVLLGAFLAPGSNLVPLSLQVLAAERFLYLPLLGPALLVGLALQRLSPRPVARTGLLLLVGLLVVTWAVTASLRSQDFSGSLRFWRSELALHPHNPVVQAELAHALMAQGQPRQAEVWFNRSLEGMRRIYPGPHTRIVQVLRILEAHLLHTPGGDARALGEVAGFLEKLVRAAAAPPGTAGRASITLHRRQIEIEVRKAATRATLADQLPTLLSMLGDLHSRLDQDGPALEALRRSVRLAPYRTSAWLGLTLALTRVLQLEAAQQVLQQARRLAPRSTLLGEVERALVQAYPRVRALRQKGHLSLATASASLEPRVHWLLAELYKATRAPLRATHHLQLVIRLAPDDRQAWATLARELSDSGDGRGALAVLAEARRRFGAEPGLMRLEARIRARTPGRPFGR